MAILAALALPAAARADALGLDLGPLSTLVAQGSAQLTQVAKEVHTLEQNYEEAKKVASYADDAAKAFNAAKSLNGELFGQSLVSGLSVAFPDIQRVQRDVAAASAPGGNWAQGSGQLGSLVTRCLGGSSGGCIQVQNAVSASDTRHAISEAFGVAPSVGTAAADGDAAMALAQAQADVNRNKFTRDVTVAAAMSPCTGANGFAGANAQACQSAANAAQIQALRQQAFISDQLATQSRLQADSLAVQNSQQKVQLQEASERRSLLVSGVEGMDPILTGGIGGAEGIGADLNER